MNVDIQMPGNLSRFFEVVGPSGRRNLYSAAASAVCALVRSHIASESTVRHSSAQRLGASPTGHLSKGARAITFAADQEHGEVVIPIPGISRAFHDVEIVPTRASRLTIPINALSYGRRVRELQSLGWIMFTPPKGHDKEDILFGSRGKGKNREVVPLYVLKNHVKQKMDKSLMPSQSDISTAAARAIYFELKRCVEKASHAH